MFERVTACDDQRGQAMLFSSPLWYHFATVLPWNTEQAREPPPPHLHPHFVHRLKNAPDCLGSWPLHRRWKWGFTGVAIWHCRWSYKHWGRPVLALLKPSSRPVRFIVNYGRFWGRRSQVHSYINPALFMGNYKTPRIFFSASWDQLWSFGQVLSFFLNLSSCRFLQPWVICGKTSLFFFYSRHLLWLKALCMMDLVLSITESVSQISLYLSSDAIFVHRGKGRERRRAPTISSNTYSWHHGWLRNEARKESTQRHRAFYNHLITLLHQAVGLTKRREKKKTSYSFSWKRCLNAHFRCRSEKYETKENETQ